MNRLLNQVGNLFLLLLGTLSQVAIIADSFSCRIEPSFWAWLVICCVLLWAAGTFRKGVWIGMPLCAVLLYLAYRFYHAKPWQQLQDLIDHISGAYYTHVIHPGESYPIADTGASLSLILLFVGFLLAAYLITALTSKNLRISLSFLETLPIFVACVVVNGSVPALASAGLLLFWFLVIATGNGYYSDGSIGRTILCCLIPICVMLGVLLMRHGPENYVYSEHEIQLNERFARYTRYFDLLVGRNPDSQAFRTDPDAASETSAPRSSFQSSWDASDNSMRLSQPFDDTHADLRLLQVRAETSGRMYLRTQSYGDYTGTGWQAGEDLSSGSSLPFAAFAAERSPIATQREIEVRTFVDLPALCIPYYAAVSTGSDISVSTGDQPNYRVSYVDYPGRPSDLSMPGSAASAEQLYRSHAHSVYTRLPESTRQAASQICSQAGLTMSDPDVVQAVSRYVQNAGEYDLETAAYPSDDYAIYFLTQSHRGYCIHFATAAAVLYRSLGIPARVTEGFAVETRAGALTDVVAGDSHAWVEIYLDGVGWIPVEVTAKADTDTPETTTEPAQPSPESTDQPETQVPEPVSTNNTDPDQPGPGGGGGGQENPPSGGFPWPILLILPGLALLLGLWYLLARARFTSQIQNTNSRKAVIACWRYAKRAAAFGGEIPAWIVSCAEKVAFSPHTIHKDELDLCRQELQALIDTVYPTLRPLRKFRFRFLFGMR